MELTTGMNSGNHWKTIRETLNSYDKYSELSGKEKKSIHILKTS